MAKARPTAVTLPAPTLRSARTNSPVPVPRGLDLVSSRGRRWRDLVTIFAEQLGEERMRDEAIKTRLGVLVMLTLELERLSEEQVCDRPLDPHQLVHLAQEQRALMQELGLGSAAHLLRNKGDAPEQSDLHAYVEAQS